MKEKILLVFGGNSVEHEISIITALQAYKNYKGSYELILIYLGKDNQFYAGESLQDLSTFKHWEAKKHKKEIVCFNANQYFIKYGHKKIDFRGIYLIVHGNNCEDGTLYAYFKTLNLCCIAMDPYSGIVSQSKLYCKKIANVKQLPYVKITEEELQSNLDSLLKKIKKLSFPILLKPDKLGSSVGVVVIRSLAEFVDQIHDLFTFDSIYLAEPYLENIEEYNIAILKNSNRYFYSEIEKIVNHKVLSYEDKYINDKKSMEGISKELPAKIDEELRLLISDTALKVYQNLNSKYCCRVDFIYDKDKNQLYFSEINNIPGSLSFYLFERCNLSISQLVDLIIQEGLYQWDQMKKQTQTLSENIFSNVNIGQIKLTK